MVFERYSFVFAASFVGSVCFGLIYYVGYLISDARTEHLSRNDILAEGVMFCSTILLPPLALGFFVYNTSLIQLAKSPVATAILALANTFSLFYIYRKLSDMSERLKVGEYSGFTLQKLSLMAVVGVSVYIPATLSLQNQISLSALSVPLPVFTISIASVYFGQLGSKQLPTRVVCGDKEYLGWRIDEDDSEIALLNDDGLKRVFKSEVRSVEQPSENQIKSLIDYARKSDFTIESSFPGISENTRDQIRKAERE